MASDASWAGVFRGLNGATASPAAVPEPQRRGFFRRLRENLGRSSRAISQQLSELAFDPQDAGVWERLEEALIFADVGVPATVAIVEQLEAESAAGRLQTADELRDALTRIVADMLRRDPDDGQIDCTARPSVLLVVGVNGTGK